MITATRGSVQRAVANPWACGPCRRAVSTWRNWAGSIFGFRPARPAPRNAAAPPWRQARYQRMTL